MKRRTLQFLIVVMVVSLFSSAAFAWSNWPGAMKGKGRWAVDATWIHQDFDVRGCEMWEEFDWVVDSSWVFDFREYGCIFIKDLESNIFLVSLEYGVCDMFEVALLLGTCDVEGKYTWLDTEEDNSLIKGGSGLAIGAAARGTFCQWDSFGPSGSSGPGGTLSLGWNGQVLYCDPGDTRSFYTEEGYAESWTAELDWWQGRCMLGLGWQRNQLGLYTDVGFQWVDGDITWTGLGTDDGVPDWRGTGIGHFRQDTSLVVAAGGWYQVNDDLHVGGGVVLGEDVTVYYISGQYRFR